MPFINLPYDIKYSIYLPNQIVEPISHSPVTGSSHRKYLAEDTFYYSYMS